MDFPYQNSQFQVFERGESNLYCSPNYWTVVRVFLKKECGSGLFQTMDFMKSLWLLCTAMHFVSKTFIVLRSVLRILDIYR